jgi:hypothetical protein
MPCGTYQKNRGTWKAWCVNDEFGKFLGFVYGRSEEEACVKALCLNDKFRISGDPCPLQFWTRSMRDKINAQLKSDNEVF